MSWPNALAEKLRQMAEVANLANRYVRPEAQYTDGPSYWDSWIAAEDDCPARVPPVSHYAPNLDRRIRRSKCYFCHQYVFHR